MTIDFSTQITRAGEDKHVLTISATVPTEADARCLERWVKGAFKDACGRDKLKQCPIILPPNYRS